MAYLENNSTNKLLLANQEFLGTTVQIPADYVAAQVSFNVAGSSGRLEFLHSFNGVNFQTYGDIFEFEPGEHARQVSLKAQFFRIKYINGSSNQTNFNLHTRIGKGGAFDDMNVNIDYRYDSISVVAGGTGLNTRLLTIDDQITIPSLDACVTGNSVNVNITGGSLVIGSDTNIFASNGDILTATSGGLDVHVDNFSDIPKLSSITDSVSIPALTSAKDSITAVISGTVPVSGSVSITNQITGFSTSALQTTGNNLLTDIKNKTINKTTDSIDISGQSIVVNTIEGYATSDLQIDTNDRLDTLSSLTVAINNNVDKIVNRTGDIQSNIYYTEGASVWADSVPIPTVNPLVPSGWLYTNTNTGNAMNLFYFNGVNEIRRLEEVSGQYAVVSNLSTKTNDKMIFGIYTKSSSSFFTTRITHSNPSGIDMIAGGKYLLYWGEVESNLYPNLPRINFTDVVTTGPAVPTEEILSVSLNSDSGAPAGDIVISIEALGVVFNGESRTYNLLGSPTEYETLVSIRNNTDDIEYKTNLLSFFNESGINELMVYDESSESNLINIKSNTDGLTNLTFTGNDLNVNVSNTSFEVSNFPSVQGITGSVNILSLPSIEITNTSFEVSNFPSVQGITGSVNVLSLPSIEITNTSFEVSNFPSVQGITGSVNILSLPSIEITNTSFEVSNFPSVQGITGSVNILSLPSIEITNTSFEVSNFPASISNFALESGGNLASIKTQTDKLQFNGANLKTQIMNTSLVVETSTNALDVNIVGGSAADGKAYLYSGNGITPITQTTISAKSGIDTNIINASIDTVSFGKTSSGVSKEILVTSDGELITDSNMHSGIGVPLTSTSIGGVINNLDTASTLYSLNSGARTAITATGTSLNTNITNTNINTHIYGKTSGGGSGTWKEVLLTPQGELITESQTQDGSGNAITSTLNGAKQSLDVNVANTVAVSGTFYQATQPVSIASTVAVSDTTTQGKIDTTNSTLSTINGKVPSGLSVSSSRLLTNSQASAFNISTSSIDNLTSVQPSSTTGVKALHTVNYNQAYNEDSDLYVPISSKTIGSSYALLTHNIRETKEYTFGGIDNNPTAFRLIGGNASSSGLPLDLYNYGLANPRTYWASLSGGTPSTLLYIDYVNSSGNLVENEGGFTLVATDNTTNWTLLPSMIGTPIKFRTSTAIGDTVNTGYGLFISPVTNRNRSICHSSIANYGIGVFTIPNGYIGYITSLTAGYATAGSVIMVKWNVDGIRHVVYKINIETSLNIVVSSGFEGTLGGIFVAGESIAFTNNLGTSAKLVQASITLKPI
jgi:hypothetical protein